VSDINTVVRGMIEVIEGQIVRRGGRLPYKSYDQYRARLWGAMLRLYNGGRDASFLATFARSIDQQLTQAWNNGADEVGVAPDEMTLADIEILNAIIANENDFIARIAGEIQSDHIGGGG